MPETLDHAGLLDGARIDPAVAALRPDYRVLLLVIGGLTGGPSDAAGEELLSGAETAARLALMDTPVEDLPHVAAWREAYRAFGAKPQRNRNSLEALLRRVPAGLPRVNRLTDVYNAISVGHQIPLGGEDAARYVGSPQLIRAVGTEVFDTVSDGEPASEHPLPGEVVWVDNAGVTCRRWNWRQGQRTRLTEETTTAIFVLDALEPLDDDALDAVGDDLEKQLRRLGPDVHSNRRLLRASEAEPAS